MRQKLHASLLLCVLICIPIIFSACVSSTTEAVVTPPTDTPIPATITPTRLPPTPETEKKVIGAILFLNDNFFETVALGMEDVAKEAGVDIQFHFHEDDVLLETQWIYEFVQQGVDAILISPRVVDLDGSIAAIHEAYKAGIPVVCYNGCFTDEVTAENVAGIFETDQYSIGYRVGEYLVSWLEARGLEEPHIGILSCCEKRDAGFRQALLDHNLTWYEDANYEEYRADESMVAAENMLQRNPQITILWAQNEGATIGAVSGVRAENLAGQVFVFGVDMSPQIAQMLLADDDILQAVAAQSPYEIGKLTAEAALVAMETGKKAGYHNVDTSFFSRDDLTAVKAYLADQ
ncbi:MAG: substrate-binding domain-containing protein [Anaerolineae bacterium]|nr:substrate-binding domain-containing protein [Anaerolineae bacterium]